MSITWQPTNTIVEDWGTLRVVIGDVDVTTYEGAPTLVRSLIYREPFDDAAAELSFPRITPHQAYPAWLSSWALVEIHRVRPDGSLVTKFEGLVASVEEFVNDRDAGVGVHCIGALYELDLRISPPSFGSRRLGVDVSTLIAAEFARANLHTAPLAQAKTGVFTNQKGSFQPTLTGYVQDLLSMAQSPTLPPADSLLVGGEMESADGYWVVSNDGTVIPYGPDTPYYGSAREFDLQGLISGMARHPDGYLLVGEDGGVFVFGEGDPFQHGAAYNSEDRYNSTGPTFYGEARAQVTGTKKAIDIEGRPQGDGYWVLIRENDVVPFGAAIDFGAPAAPLLADMAATHTGGGYWLLGVDGGVFSYGDASFQGSAPTDPTQVAIAASRSTMAYYTVNKVGLVRAFGGIAHYGDMSGTPLNKPMIDMAITPSGLGYWLFAEDGGVFAFGDAVFDGSVPTGPGTGTQRQWTIVKEAGRRPVMRVKDRTNVQWTVAAGAQGVAHRLSRDASMAANVVYGEGIDNDNCRWRNSQYPTTGPARIDPLALSAAVDPASPSYDAARVRVEKYQNYGEHISKLHGQRWAGAELTRDDDPGHQGTITLGIDPEEGSRFDIEVNQNIKLRYFHGADRVFHISEVNMDFDTLLVTLTVDDKARDWLTIQAIAERDRETNDPTRRRKVGRRSSRIVEDRISVWDCENGAGVIPATALPAAGWYVVRVPAGERGDVANTYLTTSPAAAFSAGFFKKAVTAATLAAIGSPLDDEAGFWDRVPDDTGIMLSYGEGGNMAGYYPGENAADAPLTGTHVDASSWYFESEEPPWLWIAVWVDRATTFSGRLHPGVEAY